MPRVRKFEELPEWLQLSIRRDWENVVPSQEDRASPPIRDPEYRVHRIGDSGWWAVDCGTGGVIVQREGQSHNYDDLPEGELKALVDAEGRATRDVENIEHVYEVILSFGVHPRSLREHVMRLRADGCTDREVLEALAALLQEGLREDVWLIG